MPYYAYAEFVSACSISGKVVVTAQAQKDAEVFFKLRTQTDLLLFISDGGLEDPVFINTKEWIKNPDPGKKVLVDAYNFNAMYILGYIAFMKPVEKWVIKSFHLSEDRNPSMMLALLRAGYGKGALDAE